MVILRKKHILAVILAGMLFLAGYINYTGQVADVSGEIIDNSGEANYVVNLKNNLESIDENYNAEKSEDVSISDAYFVSARLEKEETYEKQMECHKEIMYDEASSEASKLMAQEELNNIVEKIAKEMSIENLIEAKGFKETLAIINDDNVNVIVKTNEDLTVAQVAQIQNIVMREANSKAENIHIVTKK